MRLSYIKNCITIEPFDELDLPSGDNGIIGLTNNERTYLFSLDTSSEVVLNGFPNNQRISWLYRPSPDNKWIIAVGLIGDERAYWIVGGNGESKLIKNWPKDWRFLEWEDSSNLLLLARDSFTYKLVNPIQDTVSDIPYDSFLPEELEYANFWSFRPLVEFSPSREWLLYTGEMQSPLIMWNTKTKENAWTWTGGEAFDIEWVDNNNALVLYDAELYQVNTFGDKHQITNVREELSESLGQVISLSPDGRYVATWLASYDDNQLVIIDLERATITNYCIAFQSPTFFFWHKDSKKVVFGIEDTARKESTILFDAEKEMAFRLMDGLTPLIWWFPK